MAGLFCLFHTMCWRMIKEGRKCGPVMPRNVGGAASGGLNLQTPLPGAGSADLGRILLLGEGDGECSLHWLLPHAPFLRPVLYHPIWDFFHPKYPLGCPSGSAGKESSCNVGDLGLIPELGKSPGEGNGYLLRYFPLENSMDRGACWIIVHGFAKSWTQQSD